MLDQADFISVFGVSNNGLIIQEFKHNMRRIGKMVEIVNQQGELVYAAGSLPPNFCAVIVSYSGETPVYHNILDVLKENQVPVLGITSIGDNTVSKGSDIVLRLCTREKLYSKIGTFCTDASIEYLLHVLYAVELEYKTENSNRGSSLPNLCHRTILS